VDKLQESGVRYRQRTKCKVCMRVEDRLEKGILKKGSLKSNAFETSLFLSDFVHLLLYKLWVPVSLPEFPCFIDLFHRGLVQLQLLRSNLPNSYERG
jgi:hypothetical protein